jgi:hypothetical protein
MAVVWAMAASGQEAVRMSMASAEAAAARRRAAGTMGYYNLKLGPTAWRFTAGLGVGYNSNVRYTEDNPEGDVIFSPEIRTRMLWPVSDQNSVNLALGAGYSAYVEHSELSRYFILPGSELSFDFYAGDFWINLHDRFSVTTYTYQDPSVAGTGDYAQMENAVGPTAVWDLNKGVVRLGYDHVNYDSLGGNNRQYYASQASGAAEVFSASAGLALKPGTLLGVELGGSLITYNEPTIYAPYTSARQWNAGGFLDTPVSEYIHFMAHAGYTVYSPESTVAGIPTDDFTGVYAQVDIRHRLNEYVEYSLSGGRTVSLAFWGGTVDRYYARWSADWKIVRKVTLSTSFGFEHGTQLYGVAETYNQYGPGITLRRSITEKLAGNLGYQVFWRDSDKPGRNYTVNIVSLNFNYTF